MEVKLFEHLKYWSQNSNEQVSKLFKTLKKLDDQKRSTRIWKFMFIGSIITVTIGQLLFH